MGGIRDVDETTRKIMRSLITNDLARHFNHAGHVSKQAGECDFSTVCKKIKTIK